MARVSADEQPAAAAGSARRPNSCRCCATPADGSWRWPTTASNPLQRIGVPEADERSCIMSAAGQARCSGRCTRMSPIPRAGSRSGRWKAGRITCAKPFACPTTTSGCWRQPSVFQQDADRPSRYLAVDPQEHAHGPRPPGRMDCPWNMPSPHEMSRSGSLKARPATPVSSRIWRPETGLLSGRAAS